MMHEWDWPPTQRRKYYRSPKYYRTIDMYQPSGWHSPGVTKAVDIYWRTIVTLVKMAIAVPLTIMLLGSLWLLWVLAGLVV
jgi:hypothetical protein